MSVSQTSNLLIVSGANGTGTSLVLAMLNARPDVFVMYEVRPHWSKRRHYTRSFLKRFPETKPIFADSSLSPVAKYARLQTALRERGHTYRYFGDKAPTLDAQEVAELAQAPFFIFIVRDIRAWLCKDKIFRLPQAAGDVVPLVRQYMALLFEALAADHGLILRLEDCVLNNPRVIARICDYLRLPDQQWIGEWWQHIKPAEDDPKTACRWFGDTVSGVTGKSAGLRPVELDVEYKLREHRLWDIVLPVFEKYYDGIGERRFPAAEIAEDRERIGGALEELQAPLNDLFESFTSWRFAHNGAGRATRRSVWRLNGDRQLLAPSSPYSTTASEAANGELNELRRPVFVIVDGKDSPISTIADFKLLTSKAFRDAVDEARALVVRLSWQDAQALLPDPGHSLHPRQMRYLHRRAGSAEWRILPEDASLDVVRDEIRSSPKEILEVAKEEALATAREGIAELEQLGFKYELRMRRPERRGRSTSHPMSDGKREPKEPDLAGTPDPHNVTAD